MWKTVCTVGTFNVDVAKKITINIPHQHYILIYNFKNYKKISDFLCIFSTTKHKKTNIKFDFR